MADRSSYGLAPRLDIEQILLEAHHRWLRPAEICEILRNYQKFQISPAPPDRPPSGSLFLFDRKVLRYFRKDGHNWRKKKDGKTVKEAHEKLKVGSIDVLHCYYAHGEENESFQRRSYWMLELDLMHIVFVHYLEVKASRTVGGIRESSDVSSYQQGSPLTSGSSVNHMKITSGHADSPSPTSTLTSLCEDADSEDAHQASSRFSSIPQVGADPLNNTIDFDLLPYSLHSLPGRISVLGVNNISDFHGSKVGDTYRGASIVESQQRFDLASGEVGMERYMSAYPSASSSIASMQPESLGVIFGQDNMIKSKPVANENVGREELENFLPTQSNWQIPFGDNSLDFSRWPMEISSNLESAYDPRFTEQRTYDQGGQHEQHVWKDFQGQSTNAVLTGVQLNFENDINVQGNASHSFPLKKSLLEGEESLKKVDSFSRWIAKELVEVDDLQMQSSSSLSWNSVECGTVPDESPLSPSLSQDQLFSIIDFSPKWAYTDLETKVLIIGSFLRSRQEVAKGNWSCMFGEVEVPAEVIADGILGCHAPPHNIGQVPFYVTCSNRLACSEVREFDYRVGIRNDLNIQDIYRVASREALLYLQLDRLLSLKSLSPATINSEDTKEKRYLISRIMLLKEEEECYHLVEPASDKDLSLQECKEHLLQKFMKEKLYSWLLHKVLEDGKGPNVLDEEGQGVLHLGAALGYEWAIKPTVTAGVSINFRDVSGWSALHWAAFCGREQTVAILISLGAAPGALTDPSPEFPLGRTPADLASSSGHKGISGFLAESSLTNHLTSLTINESNEEVCAKVSGIKAVQTVSERTATHICGDHSAQDEWCLRDSLNAVCNATQAASLIQQVYEKQKLEEKQLSEYGDDVLDMHAVSLVAGKKWRPLKSDGLVHAAATHIQKKFRGWKKRKEFLLIRQRIVKIQAHVRGHQVRKQYKTIIWSVGILEKVILRWRRKGSGLRGFRRDALTKDTDPQMSSKEDDYDFLKEGRKQTEERLEKALTRVKSMVQYPEGRAQYRRLLTVVEGIRETKACDMVLTPTKETTNGDEDLADLDSLLDDDTFMSIAFQ